MAACGFCTLKDKCVGFGDCPHMASESKKCICKGNWRELIAKYRKRFGTYYLEKSSGEMMVFVGILDGEDDYYFFMAREDKQFRLYSCVGSLKTNGLVRLRSRRSKRTAIPG